MFLSLKPDEQQPVVMLQAVMMPHREKWLMRKRDATLTAYGVHRFFPPALVQPSPAFAQDKPFIMPIAAASPSTWLFGQPYGNTVGAAVVSAVSRTTRTARPRPGIYP